ncbi:MAG TPA: RNA methyltransferase, partial [Burkholderiales bacterium]|nr:RNA methyltransferase [Burkholderiales bacterium]
ERRLAGCSLLDGVHLLQAYQSRFGKPEQIIVSRAGADNPEIQMLLQDTANTLLLNDNLFKQLSSVATPTGIIAIIKTPRREALPAALETCVMLEDVQDPGNLGSILRSCAATAIKQIFLSKQTVNAWSPRVLRAGMGAHFNVEIYERVDLIALAQAFPGRVLVAQSNAKETVFYTDLSGNVALVFGNEGAGVSAALMQYAHASIAIPMSAATESLNVAAAAAVFLFERVRQLQ